MEGASIVDEKTVEESPVYTTTPPIDYIKALDEFIDICDAERQQVDKKWPDHSIRALVRQCVAILTRMAYPGDEKKIFKADWLFIAENLGALASADGNLGKMIAQANKYAEHGTIFHPFEDAHEAMVCNIRDLCLALVTQKKGEEDSEQEKILDKLMEFQKTWFSEVQLTEKWKALIEEREGGETTEKIAENSPSKRAKIE
jgi:hypothetical protein